MLSDGAGVQQLPAGGATETELVVDIAQTFHFLGKVDVLVASRTNAGHFGVLSLFIWKSRKFENLLFAVTILNIIISNKIMTRAKPKGTLVLTQFNIACD